MKLFRKSRMQQIKSERIIKYMAYALGEIILVVIGILIALQINNWNAERSERKKELNYLKEIKSNLKTDSLKLEQVIDFNDMKQAVYDTILRSYDINNPPKILNIYVGRQIPLIAEFEIYSINSTAFKNMNSADNISVISNLELRQKLTSYYSIDPELVQEKIKLQTRELTAYLSPKIITNEGIKQFYGFENALPSITANDFTTDNVLFGYMGEAIVMMGNQTMDCRNRLEQIEELTDLINTEIADLGGN